MCIRFINAAGAGDRCPICHKDLQPGFVARAGYEPDNYRTVPPTIGRGQYCDHIPRPEIDSP